jgi:predicted GTPase
MDITGYNGRRSLLDWAERVRVAVADRDPQAAAAIDLALDQFRNDRFVLTVLGKAKRGKSTLVNALLGRHDDLLAPIDKLPASNAITRFVWAEEPSAKVYYRAAATSGAYPSEIISYDRVREFATEELNPGNRKGVDTIEVAGPFANFDRDLVLIDTPGAGSVHEYHDALLHSFLPQSDAVIFLVTARMPLDQDELDLLHKVRAADVKKVLFAINKVDRAIDGDIDAAVSHNAALLAQVGIQVSQIHRISAKLAFEGQFDCSGLTTLLAEVRELLVTNKAQVLAARLVSRVSEAASPVVHGLATELMTDGKSEAELEQYRQTLATSKQRLGSERQLLERQFQNRWNAAVDAFAHHATLAQSEVKAAILTHIGKTSLVNIAKLARDLPTITAQGIEAHLHPFAEELESALQRACQDLRADYPSFDVQSTGAVAIKTPTSHVLAFGTAGATAAAAAGVGIVAAANAAAAASVAIVTTPSLVGAALTYLTGTSAGFLTSTTVPVALPLWVAMAGPIGWTLGGIGALTIPFAWAISKSKQRAQLEEECGKQVDKVFDYIQQQRISLLRRSGDSILEDVRVRLDREFGQVETALQKAQGDRRSAGDMAATQGSVSNLRALLEEKGGVHP